MMEHPATNKATILYVDDDRENLESFRAVFRREYNVLLAHSAVEAIKTIHSREIQVLITDQRMPKMSGSELLAQVADEYPSMLRFMLTGFSDFDPLVDALNRGKLQGYFTKPLDVNLVRKRIEEGLSAYYLNQERKRLNRALAKSEAQLRSIFDQAAVGIGLLDATGKFQMVNEKLCEVLNYDKEELLAATFQQILFHDSSDIIPDSKLWKDMSQAKSSYFSVETIGKRSDDQTIWVSINLSQIHDRDDTLQGMLVILEDITPRKIAEEEKKMLLKHLQQSQKMEAIGTLAGGIAHDFNNILTSILGFTELLQADEAVSRHIQEIRHIQEYLAEIHRAGLRAKELVNQILTFARKSDDELKPVRVDVIAKEVLKLLHSTTPAQIKIYKNIQSNSLVLGNSTQLYQIIMNLCTNAIDSMEKEGGVLVVSLRDKTLEESPNWSDLKPGAYVEFRVEDTGCGIAPEIMDSIFEPYFTSKEMGKGTGLGLATVHGIVTNYHGEITVKSTLGKGTSFTILLPTVDKHAEALESDAILIPIGTERILVVDDEEAVVKVTAELLTRQGYQVVCRTSSAEALELFRDAPDKFDIVITDLNMPHMKGDRLADKITAIRPEIPVILCTGYNQNLSSEQASRVGIKKIIQKPILRSDFCIAVRNVLDGTAEVH